MKKNLIYIDEFTLLKIFISYSKLDASGTAKEIHNYLTEIGH